MVRNVLHVQIAYKLSAHKGNELHLSLSSLAGNLSCVKAWRKHGSKSKIMRRLTSMMDEHYPGGSYLWNAARDRALRGQMCSEV